MGDTFKYYTGNTPLCNLFVKLACDGNIIQTFLWSVDESPDYQDSLSKYPTVVMVIIIQYIALKAHSHRPVYAMITPATTHNVATSTKPTVWALFLVLKRKNKTVHTFEN